VLESQEILAGATTLLEHVPLALAAIRHLFPDGPAALNVVDFDAPSVRLWTDPPDIAPPDAADVLARCSWQHPIMAHVARTRDRSVLQFADFPDASDLHGTELWAGVFERVGIDQQMAATFAGAGLEVGLTAQRAGAPYSERERALFGAARPGFAAAFTAAVATERLAALHGALAETGRGYVVVDERGVIASTCGWVTESLAEDRSPAPDEVVAWANAGQARRARVIVVSDGERVARLQWQGSTTRGVLVEVVNVLEGQRSERLGLTRRETEVLSVLASGVTPADAADALHISVATLHKHLEHAYRRLGVSGLRAALARLDNEA